MICTISYNYQTLILAVQRTPLTLESAKLLITFLLVSFLRKFKKNGGGKQLVATGSGVHPPMLAGRDDPSENSLKQTNSTLEKVENLSFFSKPFSQPFSTPRKKCCNSKFHGNLTGPPQWHTPNAIVVNSHSP